MVAKYSNGKTWELNKMDGNMIIFLGFGNEKIIGDSARIVYVNYRKQSQI